MSAGDLDHLEAAATMVGDLVGAAVDELGLGFVLLMFTFGPGWTTFVSNAEREDVIRMLRTTADRIEAGAVADAGTGGRLPS